MPINTCYCRISRDLASSPLRQVSIINAYLNYNQIWTGRRFNIFAESAENLLNVKHCRFWTRLQCVVGLVRFAYTTLDGDVAINLESARNRRRRRRRWQRRRRWWHTLRGPMKNSLIFQIYI